MSEYTRKTETQERVTLEEGHYNFYRADGASKPPLHLRLVIRMGGTGGRSVDPIDRPVSALLSESDAATLDKLIRKAHEKALAEAGFSLVPPPAEPKK